jgi:hypothetical protein
LFGYDFSSVVLALYLAELGFDERQISLSLAGDTAISIKGVVCGYIS